jgi:hypothetical protein
MMNLKEHKNLLWEYEKLLRELSHLRDVGPKEEEWWIATSGETFIIPLTADYVQPLLRERILYVEKKAKDIAETLGITFEERSAWPQSFLR